MDLATALALPAIHNALPAVILVLIVLLSLVLYLWYEWYQEARAGDDLLMQYAAISGGRDVWQAVASWSLVIVGRRVQIVRLRSVARRVTI